MPIIVAVQRPAVNLPTTTASPSPIYLPDIAPVTITLPPTSNIDELLHALEVSINANTLTNLVHAYIEGNLVIIRANTPGAGGNAITLALTTTSKTVEGVAP